MSSEFRKQFSKGSTPDPDPADNPPPAEIRRYFDRVHQQAMRELPTGTDADAGQEPVDEPLRRCSTTKLGALFFCSLHEMMHAGQIGLLRRLLGKTPLR